MAFLEKLRSASRSRASVVCIGLDPEPDRIPSVLGRGPQAAARFLRRIVAATSDIACAYKPNLAFYEQYGSAALDVLGLTIQAIPDDIPVILDAKRGDVPNTAKAYAEALFGRWKADAVTTSPYLGLDALAPFADRGYMFVLARTSNPGAADLQDLVADGRPLYEHVVAAATAAFPAERCGFVVGSTWPDQARRLREIAPDRLFLLPGIGAQGGDLAAALGAAAQPDGGGVLPAASRSILYASSGADFDLAAARAATELRVAANEARAALAPR